MRADLPEDSRSLPSSCHTIRHQATGGVQDAARLPMALSSSARRERLIQQRHEPAKSPAALVVGNGVRVHARVGHGLLPAIGDGLSPRVNDTQRAMLLQHRREPGRDGMVGLLVPSRHRTHESVDVGLGIWLDINIANERGAPAAAGRDRRQRATGRPASPGFARRARARATAQSTWRRTG